jgi:antitoxin HigA-1
MNMYNPPHPGEFINELYLKPSKISTRELAMKIGVAPSTVSRLLNGLGGLSADMALRLSKALGRSPESWLQLQAAHELWHARQTVDVSGISKFKLAA